MSVEFVHVGKYLPQTLGKHYEVPWLKDNGVSVGNRGTFLSSFMLINTEKIDWTEKSIVNNIFYEYIKQKRITTHRAQKKA